MAADTRKATAFTYECLGDDQARIARHAANSIRERDLRTRRRWLGDAYDVHRAHEAIRSGRGGDVGAGHFRGWVLGETPFSERTAYNLSGAAAMLLGAVGSAKFADLPPMSRVVAYRLADAGTPQSVRDKFLPRLLDGERVSLRELDADLKPDATEPTDKLVTESNVTLVCDPTPEVQAFARGLRDRDRRLIRKLADDGHLDMLVRAIEALEWSAADPAARALPYDTADRLADRADEAVRVTPQIAFAAPGTVVLADENEDDGSAPDAGSDSDAETTTVH